MSGARSRGRWGAPLWAALALATLPAQAGPWPARGSGLSAPAPIAEPVAVFGKDERTALTGDLTSLDGRIGILVDDATQSVCTASCIGLDLVLTAAHCIFHKGERSAPKLSTFWFSPSGEDTTRLTRIKGANDKLALQNVMVGTTKPRDRPPIDTTGDWAVLRLAAPVCAKGELAIRPQPMATIEAAARAGGIYQIGYHRDFNQWRLTLSPSCEISRRFQGLTSALIRKEFADPEHLLLHRCDTGEGSSGAPLLMTGDGGPEIVGLNAGVYLQTRALVRGGRVEKTFKPQTVANTGISAARFAGLVEAFRDSKPIGEEAGLERVQERLQALGYYRGTIDGLLGGKMREAIRAYQKAQGLPETGVPSEELLAQLAATASDGAAAPAESGGG